MQTCKPSTLIITDCSGKTMLGQCLPTIARERFLVLWRDAWELMTNSMLANAAASKGEKWKAVAHLFDGNPDFKFLCRSMLELFKISIDRLDIGQVSELLFFSEGGQGLLVDLQFPPMPPGGEAPREDDWIDPVARMLGLMAYRTNWTDAYTALNTIPYDQIVQAFEAQNQLHREEMAKAKKPGRPSVPQPPNDPTNDLAMQQRLEEMRRKVEQVKRQAVESAV